jgi:hypothetical protein
MWEVFFGWLESSMCGTKDIYVVKGQLFKMITTMRKFKILLILLACNNETKHLSGYPFILPFYGFRARDFDINELTGDFYTLVFFCNMVYCISL